MKGSRDPAESEIHGIANGPESPSVVDLFCGAGGLSLGFQQAGFSTVHAVDGWGPAVNTYRQNLGDHVRQEELSAGSAMPKSDVIIGGPPCQGFTSAGMRRIGDERNSLVSVFASLVRINRPRAFVFENVEGFLTAERGLRVMELLAPLVETGYQVHLQKLNAANFGVPQHRKRVIVIGGLGWDPGSPNPTHAAFGAPGASRVGHNMPPAPGVEDFSPEL